MYLFHFIQMAVGGSRCLIGGLAQMGGDNMGQVVGGKPLLGNVLTDIGANEVFS